MDFELFSMPLLLLLIVHQKRMRLECATIVVFMVLQHFTLSPAIGWMPVIAGNILCAGTALEGGTMTGVILLCTERPPKISLQFLQF